MKTLSLKVIASIVFFLFFASCSKNNSGSPDNPTRQCNIVAASYTTTSNQINYTFTYNSDNKVSKAVVKGKDSTSTYNKTYSYNGKMIYIFTDAGSNSSTDTVTLNDAGMIVSEKETTKQGVFVTKYTYGSNGLLESSTSQQDTYPPQTTSYTFSNGDLTYYVSNGFPITITYDTSKPSLPGSLDEFTQLHYYGALYYKNKHQVSSAQVASVNVKYSYNTDADGKIISLVSTYPSGVETMGYTYECK